MLKLKRDNKLCASLDSNNLFFYERIQKMLHEEIIFIRVKGHSGQQTISNVSIWPTNNKWFHSGQ